jgi:hypothetical protein
MLTYALKQFKFWHAGREFWNILIQNDVLNSWIDLGVWKSIGSGRVSPSTCEGLESHIDPLLHKTLPYH